VTEEGRRAFFIGGGLVCSLVIAIGLGLPLTGATSRIIVIASGVVALTATLVVGVRSVRKTPELPHAAPDSKLARFEHWVEEPSADPVGYCPRCGRKRLILTPFNYLPTTPAEDRALCTPASCQWYAEPAVDAPPHLDTAPG